MGSSLQHPQCHYTDPLFSKKDFGESENPIGKRMILTQRLFTAPDTTPRTGGITYTIQAVIEDIPLNTSLSFLEKLDMLTLNDSEGTLQFNGRDNMTGGLVLLCYVQVKQPEN